MSMSKQARRVLAASVREYVITENTQPIIDAFRADKFGWGISVREARHYITKRMRLRLPIMGLPIRIY